MNVRVEVRVESIRLVIGTSTHLTSVDSIHFWPFIPWIGFYTMGMGLSYLQESQF